MANALWPLADLQVVTPRLLLRYISDDLGVELALLAAKGIHDPASMPFSEPWTDARHPNWNATRCATSGAAGRRRPPTIWDLNLAVVIDGTTEMRQAVLHLIFAGVDADLAITRAWHDNAASLGVTRSLPYTQTATTRELRRDRPDTMVEFTMTPGQWSTIRRDDIRLVGIEAVRAQLETARPLSGSR